MSKMAAGPKETGSLIHGLMIDAASRDQKPLGQIEVFAAMFERISKDNRRAFISIAKNYEAGSSLGDRMGVCLLMQTVLREVRVTGLQKAFDKYDVDVSSLTLHEFQDILQVVEVMKMKTQVSSNVREDSNGAIMLADLISDLHIADTAGVQITKKNATTIPPFIAKMQSAAKLAGSEECWTK